MRQDSSNASSNDNPVITSYFTPFPFCYLADTNNRKELKKKKKKLIKQIIFKFILFSRNGHFISLRDVPQIT